MALRDAEPLKDEPSTLERFFTFLGRPQYAVGSLLSGEFQDAAENVARFGEELLTGSWLHTYRAMDLLPGDFGRNDRNERPEGSDLLRRAGFSIDRGSWGELGANLGVGLLTDPLTYVGGIGLGSKVGRVGKGALVGLGAEGAIGEAAGSTLRRALLSTEAGAKAVAEAGSAEELLRRAVNAADAQPAVRAARAELFDRLSRDPNALEEALAPYGDLRANLTAEQQARAIQNLADRRLGFADGRVSFTGDDAQREILDAGIRGLEGKSLLKPAGVPTLEIPGLTWHALPGSADQWSRIGLATPARALNGLLGLAAPTLSEALGKVGAEAVEKFTRTFYDKLSFGQIPEAARAAAAARVPALLVQKHDLARRIAEVSAPLPEEALDAIGAVLREGDDLMRKGVTQEQADFALKQLGGAPSPRASLAQDILDGRFDPNADDARVLLDADFRGALPTLLNVKAKAPGAGYTGFLGFLSWVKNENRGARFVSTARTEAGQKMFAKAEKAGLLRPAGQGMFDTFEVVGDPDVLLRQIASETASTDAIRGTLPWLGTGEHADRMRAAWAYQRQKVAAAAAAKGARPEDALRFVDEYVEDVRKQPQELVDSGVWAAVGPRRMEGGGRTDLTPFYFPSQASEALSLFLAKGSTSKKVGRGGLSYAEALADSFTKSRDHENLAETLASFRKVAEKYGMPIPDLVDFETTNAVAAAGSGLFENNAARLWLRRAWAHADTISGAQFEDAVRKVVKDPRHATTLDEFLHAALTGLGARESTLTKLLGGGDFRLRGEAARAAEQFAPRLGGRAAAVEGERGWLYRFPGIHAFVKPLLYLGALPLPAISTFTRNGVGGAVMAAMDPEIGRAGAAGLFATIRDLPLVRGMAGSASRDLQAALLAFANGAPTDAQRALVESATWGGKPAREVAEGLRSVTGGANAYTSERELFNDVGSVADWVEKERIAETGGVPALKADLAAFWSGKGLTTQATAPRALERVRKLWEPLGRLNQSIEGGLRGGAYLTLLQRGYDHASAVKKVNETFVDYAYQSGAERTLRDLLPFIRFSIGAGPNAVAGATGVVGRSVGRASVGADDGRPLPRELRGQTSIPVPGMPDTYATGLGLPFEAGAALLGMIPGAQGWSANVEQNALGALSPQLKTVAENVVGKQFYSDLPLSEVRPIGPLPPFASHGLAGFLPISRFRTELDKWVRASRGDWTGAVNALTGVKLKTVDAEREAEQVIRRWLEEAVKNGDAESVSRFFVSKDRDPNDPKIQQVKAALEALATKERARRAKG